MAEDKATIFYNHQYYYSFANVMNADDRGLQFGDGCYEWIRVHKGHPFACPITWTGCTAPCGFSASAQSSLLMNLRKFMKLSQKKMTSRKVIWY